jgi:hypothetical protein
MNAIGVTALLGWPLWFAVDRANLEGLMWAVSGAGLCFFFRERYRAAAICIGLAGCIKPFPFAFCVLLLLRRKFADAALAAGIAAAAILGAYVAIGPNPWKAYQDLKPGIALYNKVYIQTIRPVDELRFSHSVLDESKLSAAILETGSFNPAKVNETVQRLRSVQGEGGWRPVRFLAAIYPPIAIAVFVTLIVYVRKAPALNQVTAVALAATALPPNSGEYTLLNLYVPFGAFVIFLVREIATGSVYLNRKTLFGLSIAFGLLFSPLTFLRIYAGAAKLILLLLLSLIFIQTPMPSSYFGDQVDARDTRETVEV